MREIREELLELISGSQNWVYIFSEYQLTTGSYAGWYVYSYYSPNCPTSSSPCQGMSTTFVQEGNFLQGTGGGSAAAPGSTYYRIDGFDSQGNPLDLESQDIYL